MSPKQGVRNPPSKEEGLQELKNLIESYELNLEISKTNEQGIMNLYFNCTLKIWKQIQTKDNETRYYDMWERVSTTKKDFIMLKKIRFN